MRKFEVGKRYSESNAVKFEIVKRTAKTITYVQILHAGRFNETKSEPKRTKIHNWEDREVFFTSHYQLEA